MAIDYTPYVQARQATDSALARLQGANQALEAAQTQLDQAQAAQDAALLADQSAKNEFVQAERTENQIATDLGFDVRSAPSPPPPPPEG